MTVTKKRQTDLHRLKEIFQSITAASCPSTYNFHLHTLHSDGRLEPQHLIEQAIQRGLTSLAITDHHSVGGYRHALDILQSHSQTSSQPLPYLWPGIEITSSLLETQVHILGYGFNPNHSALQPYLMGSAPTGHEAQANQVISALHQAGGLAVLAHPARYRRSVKELVGAAVQNGIDGIETFYCYGNHDPWEPSPSQTHALMRLASQYRLLQTCGTDTHGLDICRRR
ncbi:PHP domain-containing protein [Acaryochloris sp. IP29b_bin.148]|uniref:PHP domain-containing protein n=1 Tax=Acaryochloris sp. IP29b_bin.148 TaxID=2969218 RepID=UPI00261E1AC7|nr:PHP domain-containing protein [Acaryochloris sp. IP29b_bin.148]